MKVLIILFCACISLSPALFGADLIPLLDQPATRITIGHDPVMAQEQVVANQESEAQLKKQIESLTQELESTKQLCAVTESAYQVMKTERDDAYQLVKTAHADRTAALQEKEKSDHARMQAVASCGEQQQALAASDKALKQEKYRVKVLKGKLETQSTANKQLEEKLATATAAITQHEANLLTMTNTLTKETEQKTALQQQLATLQASHSTLEQEHTALRTAHTTMQEQLAAAQTALTQEQENAAQLAQQIEEQRITYNKKEQELTTHLQAAQTSIAHLEQQLASEHAEKESLQESCSKACQRETMVAADKEHLEVSLTELKKDVKKHALSIALHCNSIKGRLLERGRTTFGQVQEMIDTLVVPEVKRLKTMVS